MAEDELHEAKRSLIKSKRKAQVYKLLEEFLHYCQQLGNSVQVLHFLPLES